MNRILKTRRSIGKPNEDSVRNARTRGKPSSREANGRTWMRRNAGDTCERRLEEAERMALAGFGSEQFDERLGVWKAVGMMVAAFLRKDLQSAVVFLPEFHDGRGVVLEGNHFVGCAVA